MNRGLNLSTHDLIRWSIYVLLIGVPLIMPKLILMRLITLAIVAILGLQVFAQSELVYRKSPLNIVLVGVALILIMATAISDHGWVLFFGEQGGFLGLMTWLNLLFLVWVALNFFQRKGEVIQGMKVFIGIALPISIISLLQAKSGYSNLPNLMLLSVALGGLGAYYHITADPLPQSKQFKVIKVVRSGKLLFTLVVLGLWLLSTWFTYRQAAADYHLRQAVEARAEGQTQVMLAEYQAATIYMPWMSAYWQEYGEGVYEAALREPSSDIAANLLETALRAYEMAYARKKSDPIVAHDWARALEWQAMLAEKQNLYVKAQEAAMQSTELYKQAMILGENDPQFAYDYGLRLVALKKYSEAEEVFLGILAKQTYYRDVAYQLALIATEQKEYNKARQYIQEALRQDAGNDAVKNLLQRINQEAP